ncbi:MerR family transcriptional regulator [Hoeflea prorocentri]|uniref:Helix-turn-helix domain-containing protein n=1 Tax=Hoeflea prorocentri TaxID=1922333 RepID=A0A9X3ZHS1_9HYPH|nr:helix-turn-helix domain-containing protein [Hoeflea prorocentri]MCY6381121.1 helix-turn-helix domain-containing protein [Hoeflea prorocentri]MDA5398921.1 helix-turn-helix domain-containing protein [Hoeflea prorocentri]
MFTIGQISRETGVKVPTIRYYEQMGLISAPERSAGNQRRYSRSELQRLGFIRHARDLGLSIDAIRDLIKLSADPDMPCSDADRIAGEHLKEVRTRIRKLRRLEKELARITSSCKSGTVKDCYVLHSLLDHSLCEGEH